ncbi:MAG: HEAT repeat domain-containing protein [Planctomycetota bacterium]|jgi:HEAT repeat protein
MQTLAIAAILLAADSKDEAYLLERVAALSARYEGHARQHTAVSVRARTAVLRELAHLPFAGRSRDKAGGLLSRIVLQDRSYRVRADAARAIGRVGTAPALRAMYAALFGAQGRSRQFELIHAVLPEALSSLKHPDDLDWIAEKILKPAATNGKSLTMQLAGPLKVRLVAYTLEGVGRAQARALGPEVAALATSKKSEIRVAALKALAELDLGDPILLKAARDTETPRARAAAAGFRRLPLEALPELLDDRSEFVRRAAIRSCTERSPAEAVPVLTARLGLERDAALRLEAADALNAVTGKEFGSDASLWRAWWEANGDRFEEPDGHDDSGRTYFFQVGLRTSRVLFVIDISASMEREDERGVSRQQRAAMELQRTLGALPPKSRFAILAFAAQVRRFPEKAADAGRDQAAAAVHWFGSFKPAGATNTYGALMRAFEDPVEPDSIVLLSDGNPHRCSYRGKNYSEHEQILAEVRRVNAERQLRVHAVALLGGTARTSKDEDAESAAEFLRRLASDNRGDFQIAR